MGRRSNKRGRGNDDGVVNEKTKIAKLIDSQASKKRRSPDTDSSTTDDLRKQYGSLLTKFNPPPEETVNNVMEAVVVHESQSGVDADDTVINGNQEGKEDKKSSRRKLRKMAKPSLSQLKQSSAYPEVIEWYDCDAQYPDLLVTIKSSKNVIPVPAHWQTKREYLSGRSFLEKKPFELPDIIKQTDIEVMRKTIPDEKDNQDDPSLKQISRARVQPKLGSLDIDYKKLHDVFFKLGARWKPDILLRFGDQYYENRNLYEEAQWKKYVSEKKPGKISSNLRQIMGVPEGQLPPWCSKMKALGMPPSYPGLKIAGLNWGIENLTGDVYGVLESPGASKKVVPLFGTIISADNEPAFDEEPNREQEAAQEEPKRRMESIENITIDDGRVRSRQATTFSPVAESDIRQEGSGRPRTLYTVLKEKTADGITDDQNSKSIYMMPGVAQGSSDRPAAEAEEPREEIMQFKF